MIRGIRTTCATVLLGLIVGMVNVGPSEAVSGVLGPEAMASGDAPRIGDAIEHWLPFAA